jgi:hypothetical protein
VAFQDRSKDERERLTDIGDKIASKCKGLPLAAKVLGDLMRFERQEKSGKMFYLANCGSWNMLKEEYLDLCF